MTVPKLGNPHVPSVLTAAVIALVVLFVYHLAHKH